MYAPEDLFRNRNRAKTRAIFQLDGRPQPPRQETESTAHERITRWGLGASGKHVPSHPQHRARLVTLEYLVSVLTQWQVGSVGLWSEAPPARFRQ